MYGHHLSSVLMGKRRLNLPILDIALAVICKFSWSEHKKDELLVIIKTHSHILLGATP
jgi:hypothetical protein